MKLHADQASQSSVQAHGLGWISVGGEKIDHSVVLTPGGGHAPWGCARFEDLQATHFEQLLTHEPELVIFGSGLKLRFPHPSMHAALIAKRVGLETMDTLAACRTYNILVQEGRRVVAALILETPGT